MNPTLKTVRKYRRNLGLQRSKFHDAILRRERAGRLETQVELASYLASIWPLASEHSSECAETVDLMEMLSAYSPAERRAIAKQTVAMQCTEGCNGKCYFCSFGLKCGVTAKFSFESIKRFFECYGKFIRSTEEFLPYWNSDLFDYRDGQYDALDVYCVARAHVGSSIYVSTALPIGSEASFVRFVEAVVTMPQLRKGLTIRFSVSRKNIRRIESVLALLSLRLKRRGMTDEVVGKVFSELFEVVRRYDEHIRPTGPRLIEKSDPLRDGMPCGCADGVVLSPKEIYGTVMVLSSRYHPTGDLTIPLLPGKALKRIPERSYRELVLSIKDRDLRFCLSVFGRGFPVYMSPPMAHYRKEYYLVFAELEHLSKPQKYAAYLSRQCLSLRAFLEFAGSLVYRNIEPGPIRTRRFLLEAQRQYKRTRGVRDFCSVLLSDAEKHASAMPEGGEREELDFFIELCRAHIALTDAMFELVDAKFLPTAITYIASKLASFTLEQYKQLPEGAPVWAMELGRKADAYLREKRRKRRERAKRRRARSGSP